MLDTNRIDMTAIMLRLMHTQLKQHKKVTVFFNLSLTF